MTIIERHLNAVKKLNRELNLIDEDMDEASSSIEYQELKAQRQLVLYKMRAAADELSEVLNIAMELNAEHMTLQAFNSYADKLTELAN